MFDWRIAAVIAIVSLGLTATPVVSIVIIGLCVAGALLGPLRALQSLLCATLVCYANPNVFKISPACGPLLRLTLIVAVARLLPAIRVADAALIWPVLLFCTVVSLSSVAVSPAVAISVMKAITLALAATAVLVAANRLTARQIQSFQRFFLSVGLSVIGLSALMLLRPGLGAGSNGGLQGMLNQPQALGILIAPFAAWFIAGALLMRERVTRFETWIALSMPALIILTRARTAGAATLLAVIVLFVSRLISRRRRQQAGLVRPLILMMVVASVLAVAAVTTGAVQKIINDYAFKGTQQETRSIEGAFYASRGGGVVAEFENFKRSPLLGNGFGVYPDGHFPVGVVTFWGIPISAPVEKGFLPTAILEEGGLLGGLGLLLLVLWLARRVWRSPDLRWRGMFVACLTINVGECVLLSPGGIGMFDWLLLAVTVASGRGAILDARLTSLRARRAEAQSIPPARESVSPDGVQPA